MKKIGYEKDLFVQPFDHRGSFTKKFFGFSGNPTTDASQDQFSPLSRAKSVIYRGLLKAIDMGVDRESVGILVDSQYGGHILADAKAKGIPLAVCTEKSGQKTFDFEYGPRWQDHLRVVDPTIVKALVRFHPKADPAMNHEQLSRLKMLSDFVHASDDNYFMFELLVPAETEEEKSAGAAYDTDIRPGLMVEAIRRIQDFGVEPDIWKIEGLDSRADAEAVAAQTRAGEARGSVGNIILGRGSDKESVHNWLRVASPVSGYIGFAVGRTNFAEPLKAYLDDPSQEASAIDAIATNYKGCVDTWLGAR